MIIGSHSESVDAPPLCQRRNGWRYTLFRTCRSFRPDLLMILSFIQGWQADVCYCQANALGVLRPSRVWRGKSGLASLTATIVGSRTDHAKW